LRGIAWAGPCHCDCAGAGGCQPRYQCSRSEATLVALAEDIKREAGVGVVAIAADITTEEGRGAVLAAAPRPDILINNAGGPPPGDFRDVERDAWIRAIDENMLTPIFLIPQTIDGMVARRFGRIVNITTSGVKSPATYPQLGVSIGVRAGLTDFVGVLSRREFGGRGGSTRSARSRHVGSAIRTSSAQSARSFAACNCARWRQRSRLGLIGVRQSQPQMSASGPKRTSRSANLMSAFGGRADIRLGSRDVCF
jgi:NAD(P)-dependent dehydrogenase (short-subunit alcohol dehydrogenase family)